MNLLAHLHLADETAESRLGNLLGDFVRGRPDDRYPEVIWEGIMLHRKVDAFTDRHPHWKRSRSRLTPPRVRFAGIIVDVFYDHFLTRHWERFNGGKSLDSFVEECYRHLEESLHQTTEEIAGILRKMAREDWLRSYGEVAGVEVALNRISRRSLRMGPIHGSVEELVREYEAIESDFLAFYPELVRFAEETRNGRKPKHL